MRSLEEAKAEAAKLRELNIWEFNAFGDSIYDAIGAQLNVLEDELDEGEVYDRWGEGGEDESEYLLDKALHAAKWRDGDEDVAPSVNWQRLVD